MKIDVTKSELETIAAERAAAACQIPPVNPKDFGEMIQQIKERLSAPSLLLQCVLDEDTTIRSLGCEDAALHVILESLNALVGDLVRLENAFGKCGELADLKHASMDGLVLRGNSDWVKGIKDMEDTLRAEALAYDEAHSGPIDLPPDRVLRMLFEMGRYGLPRKELMGVIEWAEQNGFSSQAFSLKHIFEPCKGIYGVWPDIAKQLLKMKREAAREARLKAKAKIKPRAKSASWKPKTAGRATATKA